MRPEQWDRVQELLDLASALPAEEWPSFLDQHASNDAEVRSEVESLLGYDGGRLLDHSRLGTLLDEIASEGAPTQIGPYRILRVLGEGGMGVVYEAEQTEPVRRRVAIKLIRPGLTTPETLSRFDNERQALAVMGHPNIARVYEAGATDDGRPYFVMEFVPGTPITEHFERSALATRDRLELFAAVCDGIQHAHQKGIVHRDIKPSNVLVTEVEGKPVPKIIDFGVAKLAEQDGESLKLTMATQRGQIVGTLRYMSPEQAAMTGRDVDTRTDVYSLGLLLYELLTRRLPFDDPTPETPFDEMLRRRREEDPVRPSARVGAADRPLARQLKGDLDWITTKALERERARRYASASELAADIRRYLAREPIQARPPSRVYRVGRFVQRNKAAVASATLLVLALVAGIVGTSVALVRARAAEREARYVSDYMVQVFREADPTGKRGSSVTLREIVDEKVEKIRTDLAEQPATRGRLMAAMAEAYNGMGLTSQAIELLDEALPLLREAYGTEHEEVFNALNELGQAYNQLRDHEGAARYFRLALVIAERILAPDDPRLATLLKNLGDAAIRLGELDEAERAYERALAIRGEDDPRIDGTLSSLARVLSSRGDHERAVDAARRSLEIRLRDKGERHTSAGFGHFYLGGALHAAGRFEEAVEHRGVACEIFEAKLSKHHRNVPGCLVDLAKSYQALGDDDQAYAVIRRTAELRLAAPRPQSEKATQGLAKDLEEYAGVLDDLGRADDSRELRAEIEEILKQDK